MGEVPEKPQNSVGFSAPMAGMYSMSSIASTPGRGPLIASPTKANGVPAPCGNRLSKKACSASAS